MGGRVERRVQARQTDPVLSEVSGDFADLGSRSKSYKNYIFDMDKFGPSKEVQLDGVFYKNGKAKTALSQNWREFI